MGYYRGDYYTGDPGMLSDLWAAGKKALAPVGKELLSQVMGGTSAGAIAGKIPLGGPPGGFKAPQLPGGKALPPPTAAGKAGPAGEEERGPSRRMNPGNFHALRRSIRRLQSFERAARKVYHFVRPARGKGGFKMRRKRR